MEVGIVGVGVVGGALKRWFEKHTDHVIRAWDPIKGHMDSVADCDVLFICVNVPTDPHTKKQDLTQLETAIQESRKDHVPVFIRSTVLPGTCDTLAAKFGGPFYSCPEFLTARHADDDMACLPVVAGGTESARPFLQEIFPGKELILLRNTEAELAKYAHNVFAALKVNYFNTIREVCEKKFLDYHWILKAAMITGFIEPQHTQVPGPDGNYGFGGFCLPKDLGAFVRYLQDQGFQYGSLAATELENMTYRDKYVPGLDRVS